MTDIATVCCDKYLFVRFDYVCDDGRFWRNIRRISKRKRT